MIDTAICLSRMKAGVRWNGARIQMWGRFDDPGTVARALDGKVVDWQALPPLSAGWHMVQIYDPPGGVYEGWSLSLSFLVIE